MVAWVGAVKICGARTAATCVSVSGNLEDLFDVLSIKLRKNDTRTHCNPAGKPGT